MAKEERFSVPIVSIGNLIVGGSGKTPVTIALAQRYKDVFIILRGYKRHSHGLIMISDKGDILTDVRTSGDEAMLYATTLPHASVIVSEDRVKAIKKAQSLGAKVIFLDDGFSKAHIQKLDILLKPALSQASSFCLPSGPYRERRSLYHDNLVLEEDIDFSREVNITNPSNRMLLVSAISKPQRLERFIPPHIERVYYPDHHTISQNELYHLLQKYQADTILTTRKDAVKMADFGIELSILELNIMIKPDILKIVDTFIEDFGKMPKI